jgi:hypothetical protein
MKHGVRLPKLFPLAAAGLLLSAGAARGVVTGQCVQARGGNSCTAGDVTFILVGLGDQTDGCVNNTSDTLTLRLGGQLQNTSANTRYDVGMYIYNHLGTETQPAVSQGYAYNGSSCAREALKPAGTVNDQRCTFDTPAGSLDLLSGSGPFLNTDGDSCGDLLKVQSSTTCDSNADGRWDDSFLIFPDPITLRCFDGTNGAADGFVDIPTCATWGNNATEIGTAGTCSSESDVRPGTPAKCNCQNINSSVPVANLSLSCSCSPATVRTGATNGASAACTVTFTNNVACTPDLSTPERFRCGAASFLQFDTIASTPNFSYIFGYNGSSTGDAPALSVAGSDVYQPSAGTIRWTPADTVATGGGTALGVIGHNETGTLSFNYYVDPATPNNTTIDFTTTAYWSNSGTLQADHTFPSRASQSALSTTCSITTSTTATWAHVSSFAAKEVDGRVVVEWETAAEVGTAAFEVERRDAVSGRFVRLSESAVPAVRQLPGGRYRVVDPAAQPGRRYTYRLLEIDQHGKREIFGPYRVKVESEASPEGRAGEPDFTARGKDVSSRLLAAAVERRELQAVAQAAVAGGKAQSPTRAKVSVVGGGMTRVRLQDIAGGLGMPAAEAAGQIRAGRLRLSHAGQDVAWQPATDGDGIVFYGAAIDSPYTDANVYWLERGSGQIVATVSAAPASGASADAFLEVRHIETDAIPAVAAPLPVTDFWIWKSFFPGFPGFDRGTFTVEVPSPAPGPATLAVNLYGFAGSQRASLAVNGRDLAEISWSGPGLVSRQVELPAGLLRDGASNRIEIVALEAERGFWLDSFDLTYPRLYRAAGDRLAFQAEAGRAVTLGGFRSADIAVYSLARPLAPRRLGGLAVQPQSDGTWGVSFLAPDAGPYVATTAAALGRPSVKASSPADLRNPGRGAEYLVITPPELQGEARRLADLRAAQGLSTLVVDLGDVVDIFSDGIPDPLALRRFLAYAVESWSTPPRYVALAGKGTYDYRNLLGFSNNLMPPLLVATDEGIAPADAELADFDADGVPALAIGRIPAVTREEMRAYVDKLAAYESEPAGAWSGRALLIADDPDPAGDFPAASEAVAARLAPQLGLSRLYMPAGGGSESVQEGRSRLQAALREGQLLVNYIGHGGLDRLQSEGLLLTSDVPQLGNGPRLPVMTALTCLIAQYAYPTFSSLGEELVLQPDGGTAALFGPTWLSYNAPAADLARHLLPQLAQPDSGRLGDRLLRGLAAYAQAGGNREMLRLYTLLGDPALKVKQ